MRIPSGVTDQYIYFVAVDSTDLKTRETGLSGFTVYRSRNNGAATAMTTPTVAEIDVTNMPGVYTLLLDEDTTIDAGDDSQEMVFHITATGMAPVTRTVEIYRPKVTAGETINVSSGSVNNVTTVATTTTNTDMRGTDGASTTTPPTTTDIWSAATRTLTAGTNLNDLSTTDILGMAYEGSEDFQDFLRLVRAVLVGKTSGAGTGTENFRDEGDTKNRVVSTIDVDGNRTAITTNTTD